MRSAHRMHAAILLSLLAIAACSGGSTADPGNDPGGGGGNVTLTITVQATDPGYVPGVIYAYIGDNAETRARLPTLVGENDAVAKPFGASQKTVTLSVPKGKTVTLFAAEFGHIGTNVKQGGTLSKDPPPDATEFTAWTGAAGRLTTAERGVASIKMDSDASVTAEFQKLVGVTVRSIGCANIKWDILSPPYLGYGATQVETDNSASLTHGPTSSDDDWFFVYARQGTTFAFTALQPESRNPNNQTTGFQTWSGTGGASSCGAAVACNMTLPLRNASAAVLTDRNSWITSPGSLNGIGCGVCTSINGSCNLPFQP